MLCPVPQAKESWEMDLNEKLERVVLVKQKGTQYFKVCLHFCLYYMVSGYMPIFAHKVVFIL